MYYIYRQNNNTILLITELKIKVQLHTSYVSVGKYDAIRYDSVYLMCSKKLMGGQLSLPHAANNTIPAFYLPSHSPDAPPLIVVADIWLQLTAYL